MQKVFSIFLGKYFANYEPCFEEKSILYMVFLPESFLLNFRQRTDAVTLFIDESTIRAVEGVPVGAEVMAEVVSASPLALILITALVMTMGLLVVEAVDRCSSL